MCVFYLNKREETVWGSQGEQPGLQGKLLHGPIFKRSLTEARGPDLGPWMLNFGGSLKVPGGLQRGNLA